MLSLKRADPFSENSTNSTIGSTAQNCNFIDEPFELIQNSAKLNPPQEDNTGTAPVAVNLPVPDDYTEDDLMFLTENITSLPSIFLEKIPLRTPEQLRPFNHQFFKYCKKKGINPFEYFFDEFGLVVAGLGLAGSIWRDYRANYGKTSKKEISGDKEIDRAKEIADEKEKEILGGKIPGAGI